MPYYRTDPLSAGALDLLMFLRGQTEPQLFQPERDPGSHFRNELRRRGLAYAKSRGFRSWAWVATRRGHEFEQPEGAS